MKAMGDRNIGLITSGEMIGKYQKMDFPVRSNLNVNILKLKKNKDIQTHGSSEMMSFDGKLRHDLIDRPVVLGNFVSVNYHSLYDLSVLVEDF